MDAKQFCQDEKKIPFYKKRDGVSGGLGLVMGFSHGRTPSAPVRYIKISGPLWAHGNINDETGINHIIITDP